MKTILAISIILLTMIKLSYGDNETSEDKALKKIKEITDLLLENDYNGLWENCSTELKNSTSLEEFKSLTDTIYNCFVNNNVNDVSKLYHSSHKGKKLVNEKWIASKGVSYYIIPKYFGDLTVKMLHKIIGDEVTVDLKEIEEKWFMDILRFESNYTDINFDIKKYITDFLSDANVYDVNFKIISDSDQINGMKQIKREELEMIESLKNSEYIKKDSAKFLNVKINVYELFISKEKNKNLSDVDRVMMGLSRPVTINLEIIFCSESDQILITNGDKCAFYKIDDTEILNTYIKFIQDRLLTIE